MSFDQAKTEVSASAVKATDVIPIATAIPMICFI